MVDRLRGIPPRLRALRIFAIHGLRFRRFGRNSKLIGARRISVGTGVCIGDFCWVEAVTRYAGKTYQPRLILGNRVALSDLTHISCVNRIVIGDDCLLGSKIYIGDHSHGEVADICKIPTVPPARRPLADIAEVVIGEMCWICDGAIILAGSRIARCSIIAANSVVRLQSDRPALIAGAPARIIRFLDGNGSE